MAPIFSRLGATSSSCQLGGHDYHTHALMVARDYATVEQGRNLVGKTIEFRWAVEVLPASEGRPALVRHTWFNGVVVGRITNSPLYNYWVTVSHSVQSEASDSVSESNSFSDFQYEDGKTWQHDLSLWNYDCNPDCMAGKWRRVVLNGDDVNRYNSDDIIYFSDEKQYHKVPVKEEDGDEDPKWFTAMKNRLSAGEVV